MKELFDLLARHPKWSVTIFQDRKGFAINFVFLDMETTDPNRQEATLESWVSLVQIEHAQELDRLVAYHLQRIEREFSFQLAEKGYDT